MHGTPRWVKVFGLIVIVLVLLVVGLMLFGGEHGPGRHTPSAGGHTPPGNPTPSGGGHGDASGVADDAVEIAVTADNVAFDPAEITIMASDGVAIVPTSVILHGFTIDDLDAHVAAERREPAAAGGFRADRPDQHPRSCAEPGHREAGMEGTLLVEAEAGGHTPPEGGHGC